MADTDTSTRDHLGHMRRPGYVLAGASSPRLASAEGGAKHPGHRIANAVAIRVRPGERLAGRLVRHLAAARRTWPAPHATPFPRENETPLYLGLVAILTASRSALYYYRARPTLKGSIISPTRPRRPRPGIRIEFGWALIPERPTTSAPSASRRGCGANTYPKNAEGFRPGGSVRPSREAYWMSAMRNASVVRAGWVSARWAVLPAEDRGPILVQEILRHPVATSAVAPLVHVSGVCVGDSARCLDRGEPVADMYGQARVATSRA